MTCESLCYGEISCICIMALYSENTVEQLKQLMRDRGLNDKGRRNKAELVKILIDHDVMTSMDDDVSDAADFDESEHRDEGDDEVVLNNSEVVLNKVDDSTAVQMRMLEMRLQIAQTELKQAQLGQRQSGMANADTSGVNLASIRSRLPSMQSNCDIIAFFTNYERTLQLNDITDDAVFAKLLPCVLNERASKIVAQCSLEQCRNYSEIKSILVNAFKAGPEFYLKKLKTSNRSGQESYSLFLNRLSETHAFYIKSRNIQTFEQLIDDCVLNMFLESLSENVRSFVKSRQPKTAADAAMAADLHFSVYGSAFAQKTGGKPAFKKFARAQPAALKDVDETQEGAAGVNSESPKQAVWPRPNWNSDQSSKIICYGCNEVGHRRSQCAKSKSKSQGPKVSAQPSALVDCHRKQSTDDRFVIPLHIEGDYKSYTGYRDTGSNYTIWEAKSIPLNCYTGESVKIAGITGEPIMLQEAEIAMRSIHFGTNLPVKSKILVMNTTLPFGVNCILGNQFFLENQTTVKDVISLPTMTQVDDCRSQDCLQRDVNSDGELDLGNLIIAHAEVVTTSEDRDLT